MGYQAALMDAGRAKKPLKYRARAEDVGTQLLHGLQLELDDVGIDVKGRHADDSIGVRAVLRGGGDASRHDNASVTTVRDNNGASNRTESSVVLVPVAQHPGATATPAAAVHTVVTQRPTLRSLHARDDKAVLREGFLLKQVRFVACCTCCTCWLWGLH